MEHLKIELLPDGEAKITEPKHKNTGALQTLIRTTFYTLVFLLVGVGAFTYRIATLETSISGHGASINIFSHVKNFIGFSDSIIQGAPTDRINILLLGKGGLGHEGPHLTDTIILASIKPSTEEIALVSIPRDLVVWQDQYQWRKINHANSFGEELNPGKGGVFASKIIGRTLQQPIHYYITVDFNGLVQIVDILGGLKIDVKQEFTDSSYPTDDFLTTTISFEKGKQTMDGEQVLQFVRSRHGTNGESNDFARARRQQLVLESLKDQALSLGLIFKPSKINALLKTVDQNIQTDLTNDEISTFAGMVNKFENTDVSRLVLDDSPQGLLRSLITSEGAWVLTPRHGSFSEIAFAVEHVFTAINKRPDPLRVAVRNGTNITKYSR